MNWALGGLVAVAGVWMLLRWAVRLDRYEQRIENASRLTAEESSPRTRSD